VRETQQPTGYTPLCIAMKTEPSAEVGLLDPVGEAAILMQLSSRQLRVLNFIMEFQTVHKRRPLYKEIMAATEITNQVTVHRVVRRLEKVGVLALVYVKPAGKSKDVT
jgi:hypothetical protein